MTMARVNGDKLFAASVVQSSGQETFDSSDRGGQFAGAVEPVYLRLFPKPDRLTPRVPAILLSNQGSRRRFIANAVQVFERLTVDEAAKRPRALGNAPAEKPANFIEQPALELIVHAPGYALRDGCRWQPQSNRQDAHPCD